MILEVYIRIPENVETGEYVTNISWKTFTIWYYCDYIDEDLFPNVNGNVQGSIYQGLTIEFTNTKS